MTFSSLAVSTGSILQQAFSFRAYRTIKLILISSAIVHFAEFVTCNLFFTRFSTPFFVAPVSALLDGKESALYAHSIIRQYGFFVIQLSLLAVLTATNPTGYRHLIWVIALSRLLMACLGIYAYAQSDISAVQLSPSLVIDVVFVLLLVRFVPTELVSYSKESELDQLLSKRVLGLSLAPKFQRVAIQVLFLIAGGLWMLWGLGSTAFWEIGVANISSDKVAEMNLLNAMNANFIVRNQQGVMLFAVGVATALGAYYPLVHLRLLEFVMAQQIINAFSALIELLFGTILFPQFLTVFSVQVATFALFYALYPRAQATQAFKNDTKERM